MSSRLTDEQMPARLARRSDILIRVKGSGDITDPGEQAKVAVAIETFEFAGGDAQLGATRRELTTSLLGSGAVRMGDIVKAAGEQLAALGDFGDE
jgi:hypothetical protein